jgi:ppGpp synthetase/RelA/SpoT-type nucleotidyltranferase
MKKVLRLSESDLARVVRRVIKEEESMDLPRCDSFMKSEDPAGYVGGGTVLRGPIDMIKSNGTVSPEYQGYTVYKGGKPFCFIPRG